MFLIRGNTGSWPADGISRRLRRARPSFEFRFSSFELLIGSPADATSIATLRAMLLPLGRPKGPRSPRIFLIGPPVIRILPKSRRIGSLIFSNRLKKAVLQIRPKDTVHPGSAVEGLSALVPNRNNSPTENALTP